MLRKNFKKVKVFFQKECLVDLIVKVLLSLIFVYLVLFGIETIAPGLVIDSFNFNLILFIILAIVFGSYFLEIDFSLAPRLNQVVLKVAVIFLLVFLAVVLFFALHKISVEESLVYLFLSGIILKLIFDYFFDA